MKCALAVLLALSSLGPLELEKALLHAVTVGDEEQVVSLLEAGAPPNPSSPELVAPLHAAAWSGWCYLIDPLIEYGADVHYAADNQATALHWAAGAGSAACVRALITHGAALEARADVRRPDGLTPDLMVVLQDFTPLIWSAREGHLHVVQVLIENGADVNAREYVADRTAIWFATYNRHVDVVKFLIDSGADSDAVHHAWQLARSMRHKELDRTLRRAKRNAPDRLSTE